MILENNDNNHNLIFQPTLPVTLENVDRHQTNLHWAFERGLFRQTAAWHMAQLPRRHCTMKLAKRPGHRWNHQRWRFHHENPEITWD
jgi:hypothetical protein